MVLLWCREDEVHKRKLLVFILVSVVASLIVFIPKKSEIYSASFPERKIIVFRSEISREERNRILSSYQVSLGKHLDLIGGAAVTVSTALVEKLAGDPRILRVDPDVRVFALPVVNFCNNYSNLPVCLEAWWRTPRPTKTPRPTPTSSPAPSFNPSPTPTPTALPTPTTTSSPQPLPWGVSRVKADSAWTITRGSGVKVAVIDTGVDTSHPDLKENIAGCRNFISSWLSCDDDNGHGTHVAGIIAAKDNNFGVVGVAPEAKIYALKVLDRQGSGYLSDIIEALDWAAKNNLQVVNMSLGTAVDVASFHEAVIRVYNAGIVQVAAAGNSGPADNTVLWPAKYPEVIAVAATDSGDQVPSWSSRGPELAVAAPGANIYSTYYRKSYATMSGTSMAAPHVAGAVALRISLYPSESPSKIKSLLQSTATPLGFDPSLVGTGLVDAFRLVTAL